MDVEEVAGAGAAVATEKAEPATDLSNSDVVSKYREASVIAQQAIDGVLTQVVAGKRAVDICALGDTLIESLVAPLYKSKKTLEKGVAFPTCVSVNHTVAHYTPLDSEDKVVLVDGDVVKIDLGVHIDGFIAVVATTVVVGASADAPVTGPKADVIAAAHYASEVALRLVKVGASNYDVTAAIGRVAAAFGVKPVAGVLSHELKQFLIDGTRVIAQLDDPEAKVEVFNFAPHEAFALDVCFSTGEGKTRESGQRTTVYRRVVDNNYNLKSKTSRSLLVEVHRRFSALPFSLRALVPHMEKGEVGVRAGVLEPSQHEMLQAFPVLEEKEESALVAHSKITALMLPGGTLRVTGRELLAYIRSDKKLPDDLAALLATESHVSKKKAKKDKKAAGAAAAADGDAEMAT